MNRKAASGTAFVMNIGARSAVVFCSTVIFQAQLEPLE